MWGMLALTAGATPFASAGVYDGWERHAYCNDVDAMDSTHIQPLTPEQMDRVVALEQVQIVARHGARAPYTRVHCWDVKQHDPMDAEWNCTASAVLSQDIGYAPPRGYGRLYAKEYLRHGNILKGNCEIGGLLSVGRQQHLKNGEILRKAYLGDGPLKLFPSSNLSEIPLDRVYLRSDDEQRTLGSGQVLFDGLFPPSGSVEAPLAAIPKWHVTDYTSDYIAPNEGICPIMSVIRNTSMGSSAYQKHVKDPTIVQMEKNFQQHVGKFAWKDMVECLSIARCNNLPLPDGIDEELFTKVFREAETRYALLLTYNNAWYAKTAMQPLMRDIMNRMDAIIAGQRDAPRLSITMGHDSTVMPIMASLLDENWDRRWTPYAGVLIFELYQTKSSSHPVRLLFKGQPLRIPKCHDDLCDIAEFFKAVEFARTDRTCAAPETLIKHTDNAPPNAQYLTSVFLLFLTVLAAVFGMRAYRQRHVPTAMSDDDTDKRMLIE